MIRDLIAVAFLQLAATAPPPPPPPVVNQDPFIIFFDHGRADIPQQNQIVIDNILKSLRSHRFGRVHVVGHADRSGSIAFNLRLSRLRAQAVKAALVGGGIPSEKISIDAAGEERSSLVKTADGIAEPQNRFVTVMIW